MAWIKNLICGGLFFSSIVYGLLVVAVTFLSYGLSPCQSDEPVFWMRLGLSASFFVGGAIVWRAWSVSTPTGVLLAAALPIAVFAAHGAIDTWNAEQQAQCAARTLSQAMEHCNAEPSHFVKGRDAAGYEVLQLVAPGRADQAWGCLQRWSDYAEKPAKLRIDKSVFDAARQRNTLSPE